MAKKIRVWDGTAWQDVSPSLPYTAIHSAQSSMPLTGVDGQVWLDTDGTLAGQDFVPLTGGTMTGNLNTPSINGNGITGRNLIINGGFDIWQRGTSFTGQQFTADRWEPINRSSGLTSARSTDVPNNVSQYSLAITHTNYNNGDTFLRYKVERPTYVRGPLTLSFWAKLASGSTTITVDANDRASGNFTVGTTWQKYTYTFTGNGTDWFDSDYPVNSYGFIDWSFSALPFTGTIYITQVKLEEGTQATPFSRAGGTIAGEFAACQRYYYRATSENATYGIFGAGLNSTTTDGIAMFTLPVTMRTTPTALDYSTIGASDLISVNSPITSATLIGSESTKNVARINFVSAGLTAYRPTYVRAYNSTSGYIGFSAELP